MSKYFTGILVLFFLTAADVHAQPAADSVVTTDSVQTGADSTTGLHDLMTDSLEDPITGDRYLSTFSPRSVAERDVKKYLKDPDFAYANDSLYWKENARPANPGLLGKLIGSRLFRWLIFSAMIAIVLFGIYQLAKESNFRWFARNNWSQRPNVEESGSGGPIDYNEAIRKYQHERNYRQAIRYLYLRLIQTAKESGGIAFGDSSTNEEITRAFGNHPQAGEFRFLATAYEYIFYGGFIPEPALFEQLNNKFEHLQNILSS
jgi:hypothetical protein